MIKDALICPDCEGIISIDEYLDNSCKVCKNQLNEIFKYEKLDRKDISKTFLRKLYQREKEGLKN